MTQIRIRLRRPDGITTTGAMVTAGSIIAEPTRRFDTADGEVLPYPVTVPLTGDIVLLTLAPTGSTWCWSIREAIPGLDSVVRFVLVPNTVTVLDYEDLVDVDPATLDPTDTNLAAWAAAVAATSGSATAAAGSATAAAASAATAVAATGGGAIRLAVAATVTAGGTAVVNKHNPVDATAGNLTITLPTGQSAGSTVIIEKSDSTANTVTASGSIRGVAASTLPLALAKESIEFLADAAGSWWPIAGHKTLSSLDARITLAVTPLAPRAGVRYASEFPGATVRDQIVAAVADLGGAYGIVVLPTGMGAGNAGVPLTNATLWDLRGGLPVDSGIAINGRTPGVADRMRIHQWTVNPDRSVVALDCAQDVEGTMCDPSSAEGLTGQVRTRGVMANSPTAGFALVGVEGNVGMHSTGQTMPRARGGTFSVFLWADNSTNLTNGEVLVAQTMTNMGTGTVTNAISILAEDQNIGTDRNYSLSVGHTLIRNGRNIDGEDTTGTARRFITISTGNLVLFRPLSDTIGFKFADQANAASWMTLNGTAATIGLPLTVAGIVTADGLTLANTKVLRIGTGALANDGSGTLTLTGPSIQTRFMNAAFTAVNMAVRDNGDVSIGRASLATTATNGFPFIPAGAGTPTGVPSGVIGYVPLYYDTTGSKLWAYAAGAWKSVTFA